MNAWTVFIRGRAVCGGGARREAVRGQSMIEYMSLTILIVLALLSLGGQLQDPNTGKLTIMMTKTVQSQMTAPAGTTADGLLKRW